MAIQPVTMNSISSITPTAATAGTSTNSDTKNIQTQISSKQQHLKQISSDDTITATEKEEKRRELQKEIDELNRKLEQKKQEQEEKAKEAARKQAQAAARKEERLEQTTSDSDVKNTASKVSSAEAEAAQKDDQRIDAAKTDAIEDEQKRADISIKELQQMLSADYLLQKEIVQEQVDTTKENTINVLESEIKRDQIYGADTTKKEAELKTLQQKENFWSDAQNQSQEAQKQSNEQTNVQTAFNTNAKVVIDQI